MHATFAIVEGNLALSSDVLYDDPIAPTYATQIYELPVRRAESPRSAHVAAAPVSSTGSLSHAVVAGVIVALLSLALVVAAWFMISSEQRAFDSALASSSRQTITVKAGDSIWSIAEAYDIEGLSRFPKEWHDRCPYRARINLGVCQFLCPMYTLRFAPFNTS